MSRKMDAFPTSKPTLKTTIDWTLFLDTAKPHKGEKLVRAFERDHRDSV